MALTQGGPDVGNRLKLLRRDLAELDQIADELALVARQYESTALRAHMQRVERLKLRVEDQIRRLMH
jgi:hypothetical protein